MIQILGLMSMYFDSVVVEVKTFLLLFRLALAICEHDIFQDPKVDGNDLEISAIVMYVAYYILPRYSS